MSKRTVFSVDERERDTIIAALRFWQRMGSDLEPEAELADNNRRGPNASLSDEEIDELIQTRINI